MARPAEIGIALGVVDGPGQWEHDQRLRPNVLDAGAGARPVQGGTLLQLVTLRSDGREVKVVPAAGP
jgi:hypothetical protein